MVLTTSNLTTAAFAMTFVTLTANPGGTDLAFLGMPGCAAYIDVVSTIALGLIAPTSTGNAVILYSMPTDPAFLGTTVFLQSIAFDSSATNAAGVTTSNAIFLHLGTT